MANENNPNPKKIKINPWIIYGAVIAIFIFINFSTGGATFQEPLKTSASKFNSFLQNGEIEKVIVFNKTDAEVYLTPAALTAKEHKIVSKDLLNKPNKGPHYTLDIGNEEIFQKRLEEAVESGKLKDFNFAPKSNWTQIFFDLLPILLIVGMVALVVADKFLASENLKHDYLMKKMM
jgi:cell division protease FtsH